MGAIVGRVELDLYSEFVFRELTLVASQQPRNPVQDSIYYHFTGQRNRQTMLDLIRRGAVNVRDLLTHRAPYTEAPELYRRLGEAKRADRIRAAEPGRRRGDAGPDMIGVLLEWEGAA
jgi:threonine dehydrogenase-like Zn-dependent dehydrogenase